MMNMDFAEKVCKVIRDRAEGEFSEIDCGTGSYPPSAFRYKAGHISVDSVLAEKYGLTEKDPVLPGFYIFKGTTAFHRKTPVQHILGLPGDILANLQDGSRICFVKRNSPVTVFTARRHLTPGMASAIAGKLGLLSETNGTGSLVSLFLKGQYRAKSKGAGWIPLCAPSEVLCGFIRDTVSQYGDSVETYTGSISARPGRFSVVDIGTRHTSFVEGDRLEILLTDSQGHSYCGPAKCIGNYRGYVFRDDGIIMNAGFANLSEVSITLRRSMAC